jgi:hypothetical protein
LVLVDEIDLHLHPKWQMKVIGTVARALPRIQFVFTSHSPLIAGSLEWMNIIALREEFHEHMGRVPRDDRPCSSQLAHRQGLAGLGPGEERVPPDGARPQRHRHGRTPLILFLLAAVGIGLFVSSIAATMQQSMLFGFLVMMLFMLLSGLTTPISSIQYATLVNPLRNDIEISQRVYLEGVGLGRLMPDLWPMAIIAAVTLSAASWMFRHRLE